MDTVTRDADIPKTALRKAVERGAALLDQKGPIGWEKKIEKDQLGFWLDSTTPLEQIYGSEVLGRVNLFGESYRTMNLSAIQIIELEYNGFWLYQSPYTIWQLAIEWIKVVTERRERTG